MPDIATPTASRAGLSWPVRVDSGPGTPTRNQARGPHWVRTSRGLYVSSRVDRSRPEQRIVEAAAVLPSYGGVTGWAALRWLGGAWFEGTTADGRPLPITLAVSVRDIRPQAGIRVCSEGIWPEQIVTVDGVRVTDAVRSVLFEMRYAPSVRAAVKAFDMAAYNDLVSLAEVTDYASQLTSWRGIPQVREALPFCEENAWSPKEVDLRWTWQVLAGLPRPLCNVPVFDRAGNLVGVPDILDVEAGVVGEYDGALHLEGAQRSRDVRREELFRRHGLEYVTMLAGDSRDVSALVDRMVATRRRARWASESQRSWTIEPPDWWVPTMTVEQRRTLDQGQRQRLLRLRRQVG